MRLDAVRVSACVQGRIGALCAWAHMHLGASVPLQTNGGSVHWAPGRLCTLVSLCLCNASWARARLGAGPPLQFSAPAALQKRLGDYAPGRQTASAPWHLCTCAPKRLCAWPNVRLCGTVSKARRGARSSTPSVRLAPATADDLIVENISNQTICANCSSFNISLITNHKNE